MTESEFDKALGKLETSAPEFVAIVEKMRSMLDETDQDDYFGTQGWRYSFGWED